MNLGEIKLEALREMFAGYDIVDSNIANYETSEQYGNLLKAMAGSINRCLYRIATEKKIATKCVELAVTSESNIDWCHIDVQELIDTYNSDDNHTTKLPDLMEINRIAVKEGNYYNNNVSYDMVDFNTLILEEIEVGNKYIIYYHPLPFLITSLTENTYSFSDIRQDIVSLIPLWIKSELYEEDEPQMAIQARNLFESYLAGITTASKTVNQHIYNVWGKYEL